MADSTQASAIKEPDSQKRRRGRPPVVSAAAMAMIKRIIEENHSHRAHMNLFYAQHAMAVLQANEQDREFVLLFDKEAMKRGTPSATWQRSVLTELGRLPDAADICEVARAVCAKALSPADAIAFIRRVRLGPRPAHPAGIAQALRIALVSYLRLHPGTTLPTVIDGLDTLHVSLEKIADG